MALKRCKQCGILKEADEFRQYTYSKSNGTEGRYRICRACENINGSYRRARIMLEKAGVRGLRDIDGPGTLMDAWNTVSRIERLYETLEAQGFSVPQYGDSPARQLTSDQTIDQLMAFYGVSASGRPGIPTDENVPQDVVPEDLQVWLDQDMQEWIDAGLSPEYLQETVYESLRAKYRPQIGFDRDRGLPIYDDTYKLVLNNILRRFDDYEETCAESEEE